MSQKTFFTNHSARNIFFTGESKDSIFNSDFL